jgi:hypothetical protein
LLADPQSVLKRCKNYFNQMLNVNGVDDVRQMDIYTAEPLVQEPSLFKLEIAIDQIMAELIIAGGETLCSEIHKIIRSGDSVNTIKENTETLLEASRDVGLEINAEKTKYTIMSRHQNSGQNQNIRIANESFENVANFKYLGTTLTN